jgi:hypothetical protein
MKATIMPKQENAPQSDSTTGTAVAVTFDPKTKIGLLPNGLAVAIVRAVSRPTLQHEAGDTHFLTLVSPIREEEDKANSTESEKKTIAVGAVLNLLDNREYNYVFGSVNVSEIKNNYPNNTYVGKSFAIMKGEKEKGKRYFQYFVTEIAPVTDQGEVIENESAE